ncbi:MAG: hypothetical protein OXI92_08510 [Acidobacteriota bacterium]|nr:hypothetical protein [Acidobacteriota bacterium]
MKRKTTSRYLPACLTLLVGITLPPLAEAQWVPFTARYKEMIYRNQADGSEKLVAEFRGSLSRASSGSEMRTKVKFNEGSPIGEGQARLKDAVTGKVHHIDHEEGSVQVIRQLPLPVLPHPHFVPPESAEIGRRVINGVECVGKRVLVNGQLAPGAHWVSGNLQLIVREDVTFPDGSRRVVEHYDFQYEEPDPSEFAIPEDYTGE